jgi:hypothetical protein
MYWCCRHFRAPGRWIDFSRRYALVVLAKEFSGEPKPVLYQALKVLIDTQMPAVK